MTTSNWQSNIELLRIVAKSRRNGYELDRGLFFHRITRWHKHVEMVYMVGNIGKVFLCFV